MSHHNVITRDVGQVVHIFIDGGPEAICDDCNRNCDDVKLGTRFATHVVCPECAVARINDGQTPDETSRADETFKTFCDRLNAPLRAKMDKLHAETN